MVIVYRSRTPVNVIDRFAIIYYTMKLASSLLWYVYHYEEITHLDRSVSKILRRLWSYSQHPPFQLPLDSYEWDPRWWYFKRFERENIYSPGGKSYEHLIVFLGNTRGCIFERMEEKGKRGTGTRGAICSSFALITATKCLAREALVVSSATRRRPWAIST